MLTRLRTGDLHSLVQSGVGSGDATLNFHDGKAKQVDNLPLHSRLADALR
ncbi:MAG: hypothetical protein AAFV77_05740 [Planctomycetota bacterium]